MNHSRTKTLLIIISVVTVLALSFGGLLLYFIYQKEAKLGEVELALAVAEAAENSGVSMNHLLSDTKPERAKIDSYFVGSNNVVSFIEKVESLAALTKVDISINSVGIEKSKSEDAFEYVTLNGTGEGTFTNVFWFLSLLETLPLQVSIDQVFFDQMPTDPKTKTTTWRLTFTMKALKLK